MKRSLQILLCFILLNVCRPSNAQVFTENFDGSTISMFTAGTPGYSTTNAYSQSLPNSMLGLFNVNGEATLTSPDFSTLGNQYVTLQFNHICKIDFYDSCVVELSINSGVTWTQLNSATCTYLGTSPNFALVKKFSSASYPTVWDPNNAGTMSNTWWKQELFDISNLCGNQPSVRFRYRMKDASINGMGNFYGWLIDDVVVNESGCELIPPSFTPVMPVLSGYEYSTGPFFPRAYINDSSGISNAVLYYNINSSGWQNNSMQMLTGSLWEGFIPSLNLGDSVCWYMTAIDGSPCANGSQYPNISNCFIAASAIQSPVCDNFDGSIPAWTTFGNGSSWQLGTPTFGLTNSVHSFPNAWDIDLQSGYLPNSTCVLESPPYDLSGLMNPKVEFWQNYYTEFLQDGCHLEYKVGLAGNWNILGTVADVNGINWYNCSLSATSQPAWSGITGVWTKSVYSLAAVPGIPNAPEVYFRFVFNSDAVNNFDGHSIDDFCISIPPSNDIGVSTIISPVGSLGSGNIVPVTVLLQNFGGNNQTAATITYTINGTNPIVFNWTGNLQPGQVDTVSFSTLTVPLGATTICCYTSLAGDTVTTNDTSCAVIIGVPTFPIPYFDNFESGNVGWNNTTVTGSSWELGYPNYGTTSGTHSGSNAWDVDLNSVYQNNTNCFLTSPIFDFTNATDATVSFWQNFDTEVNWDGTQLQYSNDGINWVLLGIVGDPNAVNWYTSTINSSGTFAWNGNSNGWVQSSYLLSAFNNAPFVEFRFVFTSDGSVNTPHAGASIDDFRISVPQLIDGGVNLIVSPTGVSSTSTPVTLSLINYGAQTLTSMTVGVSVNGNTPQTQIWTGSLPYNQSTLFTPSFNITLPPGNNTVCAWAVPVGDGDATNDTLCTQVFVLPTVNLPYFNNFDGVNDWYAAPPLNPSTLWQLGTPNYGATTGAFSNSTCWDVNLNAPYQVNANTTIQSPYFNLSGINGLLLSFWQNQHIGQFDGCRMEYEYDQSGLWQTLGIYADPNGVNWYNDSSITAWNQGSAISSWQNSKFRIYSTGLHSTVSFRMVFSSSANFNGPKEGISMDDFMVIELAPADVGVSTLYTPTVFPATTLSPLWQIALHNYGSQSVTNVPVTITLNGATISSFNYTGIILPGDSALVVVNGFTVPSGISNLCAFATIGNDGDLSNDTACISITGVPVVVAPYFDNFDNGNIGWYSITTGDLGTNWELGTPNYGLTNSAYSPPYCWDINLNTAYTNNALCYLYSPYFDYSVNAINPYLSFWMNYNVESNFEGTRLEYSLNGSPWNVLGFVNDPNAINWYNSNSLQSSFLPGWSGLSNGWQLSSYQLNSILPASAIQFRFVFSSDASVNAFDGISIDDFTLSGDLAHDIGVGAVINPGANAGAPAYSPVTLKVKNHGYNSETGFDVAYIANGGSPITLTYNNTLQIGDSVNITLNGFTTLIGLNTIKAYTTMNSDLLHYNDTVNYTFNAVFTTTPPYADDFDAGNIGWTVDTSFTGTKWELGVPSFGATNSVHSGSACWDVNLDRPYDNAAVTRLISPVFNYVNSIASSLSVWLNYNVEYGQDGMQLQYTMDGVNYNPLGSFNDPNGINWFDVNNVVAFSTAAWSGNSLGWKHATYNTIGLSGSTYIRYAFVFKSDVNLSGDGVSVDDFELTNVVGLNEFNPTIQLLVQPNPANDYLTITVLSGNNNFCKDNAVSLQIIDATGREVDKQIISCSNNEIKKRISISTLDAGVYFIRLQSAGSIATQKFIKQ